MLEITTLGQLTCYTIIGAIILILIKIFRNELHNLLRFFKRKQIAKDEQLNERIEHLEENRFKNNSKIRAMQTEIKSMKRKLDRQKCEFEFRKSKKKNKKNKH